MGHLPLKYSWSALVFHENRDTIEEYQLSLFFSVTNMALNNYGRQLIDFEPLIRQTVDQTESDDLYDYVQSSLSSNFTSLGARVMAKMKISFSYASLSGLTPFLFYLKV